MKKLFLIAVMAILTTGAFAADCKKIEKNNSKEVKKLPRKVTLTFTDDCGTEWTVIATCNTCTEFGPLYTGINNWLADHSTGDGCFE